MSWPSTKFAHAFRRTALPLLAYYAVTIALPLANGAARSGAAFAQHALVVLVVPPVVVVFACVIHTIARAIWGAVRTCSVRLPPGQNFRVARRSSFPT